jgi:predicted TIM-barrel fold metal-dependent hydrolase
MLRIDAHHHAIPPFYRKLLVDKLIGEAGGRLFPKWSPETSLATLSELKIGTALLSVSTPGTAFLPSTTDAVALARDINDYLADLVMVQPDRFGFFATIPLPHIAESVDEVVRSLDELHADGVLLLASNAGVYLGQDGQVPVWTTFHRSPSTSCSIPPRCVSACAQRDLPQVPTYPQLDRHPG